MPKATSKTSDNSSGPEQFLLPPSRRFVGKKHRCCPRRSCLGQRGDSWAGCCSVQLQPTRPYVRESQLTHCQVLIVQVTHVSNRILIGCFPGQVQKELSSHRMSSSGESESSSGAVLLDRAGLAKSEGLGHPIIQSGGANVQRHTTRGGGRYTHLLSGA